MSDPLEDRFRDFTTGTPDVSPASPAEIRGRGDRLRRRRTALTAAGAALAVALIVTPVALLATGGEDGVQPAPPSPTVTDPPSEEPTEESTATSIPADFPLVPDGWTTTDRAQVSAGRLDACDQRPEAGAALNRVTAELSSPVTLDSRELQLFADDAAAVDYAGSVRSVFERCPEPVPGLSGVVAPGDLGDDSFTATVGGDGAGLVSAIHVVRVAHLVLVDYSLEEGDDPTGLAAASERDLVPVVAAMEELAGTPNSSGSESAALPGSFLPTARDLPTRERLTPWEQVETTDDRLIGCQPDVILVGAEEMIQRSFTARIAAAGGAPEGEDVAAEVRVSVLQYGSEAAAEAAEANVTGWIRDCADPAGTDLDSATRQGDLVRAEAGTYATWVYGAPETCGGECDAAWFERMGVLADQGRMVVVSFREVGGPLEPEGLDATMRDLMLQAAGRSMPG